MKKLHKLAAICVAMMAIAAFLGGCGSGKQVQEQAPKDGEKSVEINLAYHLPTHHHLAQSMERFAQKVNERSGGKITIKTYPAGQLYTDKSMNDAIMSGGLDMGLNSTAMWTTVIPAMNVLDVPFLLPNYDSVAKALDGDLGKTLTAELEKKGVHPLIWADYGFVQFANNKKPLKRPEDFQGLQLRGYGQIPSETIKALGASPVTMGAGEVYMAIQRGTIDGQTSGTTAMYDRKIYEVAKYLTMTNHAFCEFILAVSDKCWSGLTDEQKQLLEAVALETRDEIRKETKDEDLKAMEALQKAGMEVYQISPEEVPLWQQATLSVREDFVKQTGDVGRQLVDQCLAVAQ